MIIKILILILTIFMIICIIINDIRNKKENNELNYRVLMLEKRIVDVEKLIKLEIKGVLNNIELRDQNFIKYNDIINNRIKNIERKVKKNEK